MSKIRRGPGLAKDPVHPGDGVLSRFVKGLVDADQSNSIAAHVDGCGSCRAWLEANHGEDDEFVHLVRSAISGSDLTLRTSDVDSPKSIAREPFANGASRNRQPASADGEDQRQTMGNAPTDLENAPTASFDSTFSPDSAAQGFAHETRKVGRFELAEKLGEGGFGVVWRAHDPRLGRDVAVKVSRFGPFAPPELRQRFLRESRAAASLDHPSIVSIYEAGHDGGAFYIASEYCRGPNLAAWLQSRTEPVRVRTAASLVRALSRAVEHAHHRGVLHRDLKPSNVMLVPLDETHASIDADADLPVVPKIADFGLAKIQDDHEHETRSQSVLGTACYMAPEQARGSTSEIGVETDVYALGTILYELLTGTPPLVGENDVHTLRRIEHEEPISPARIRPHLPRDLETICLKSLEKDCRKRYRSAAAMGDDLRRFLQDEPIHARRVSQAERLSRFCRRRPAVATLTAAVVVLLVLLMLGSAVAMVRLDRQRNATLAELERSQAARHATRTEERKAKRSLFSSLIAEARARRMSLWNGRRDESLAALRRAAAVSRELSLGKSDRLSLRNEAIASLALTDLGPGKSYPIYPLGTDITGVAIDANMTRYATVDDQGHVVVRRMEDNSEVQRISDTDARRHGPDDWRLYLRMSADGRYVAARGWNYWEFPTRVWEVETGKRVLDVVAETVHGRYDQDFSHDGSLFAVARADGAVSVFDLESARELFRVGAGAAPQCLRFHPNENRLAIARHDTLEIVDGQRDRVVQQIEIPAGISCVQWSPLGSILAVGGNDARIYLIRVGMNAPYRSIQGHHQAVIHASFHPSAPLLATSSFDGTSRIWHMPTGQELVRIDGYAGDFSADGSKLSFGTAGSRVGYWRLSKSRASCWLVEPSALGDTHNVDLAPDGRLAAVSAKKGLLLFDLETRSLCDVLSTGRASRPRFHPSGDWLVSYSRGGVLAWPLASKDGKRSIGASEAIILRKGSTPSTLDFSPDGIRLMIGEEGREPGVHLYAWRDGHPQWQDFRACPAPWDVAMSADGAWLSASAFHGYEVLIWRLAVPDSRRSLRARRGHLAFHPQTNVLAIGAAGGCQLVEPPGELPIRRIETGESSFAALEFSGDGELFVMSYRDRELKIFDGASFNELATLCSPITEQFVDVAIDRTGNRIVAMSSTGAIHAWDLQRLNSELSGLGTAWTISTASH